MKASDLIVHLEAGGLIATGRDPEHIYFLSLEAGRLYCYGWGSALGRVLDRLETVLQHPERWAMVDRHDDPVETEAQAQAAILALGRWEQDCWGKVWEWNDEDETE